MLPLNTLKDLCQREKVVTPVIILSKKLIREKYEQIAGAIPDARVHYAIKANAHPEIIDLLKELGSGFEIASLSELNLLLDHGVDPKSIISSSTIKVPEFVARAHDVGVEYFAFDSELEIEKLAQYAPGSKVYLRLVVDNSGSDWPLSNKFGVDLARPPNLRHSLS